jgi:hypothetical protein
VEGCCVQRDGPLSYKKGRGISRLAEGLTYYILNKESVRWCLVIN